VAGFRIDVCNMMIKDKELRDNPPATKDDPIEQQFMGVRYVYNTDRPEAHDILRRWRTISESYDPGRLLIGETNVETLERLVQFYGSGTNELHGGFNFTFMQAPFEAAALRAVVEGTEALLPEGAWPTWHGSNHDFSRLSTRWAGGDPDKVKVAVLILLTLRGTPFLYQGDEIGLVDGEVPHDEMLDPVGVRFFPYAGRDPVRTPMPWHGGPGGGFSEPGVRPWLPITDPAVCNVADQEGDAGSVLEFCRRVIAARRASDDLAVGDYRSLPSSEHSWAYARGEGTTVVLNMSDAPESFEGVHGVVTVSTDAGLEGSSLEGGLTLPAWSGAVAAR
jgi:alpha-glucosidase